MKNRKLTEKEQELYDSLQKSPISMQGGYGVFIKSNGEEVQVNPSNGLNFDLEEMQTYVGGYAEAVYMESQVLLLNELANIQKLPINKEATRIYQNHFGSNTIIKGDVLVCPSGMIK